VEVASGVPILSHVGETKLASIVGPAGGALGELQAAMLIAKIATNTLRIPIS
jgi:hypothetical protein